MSAAAGATVYLDGRKLGAAPYRAHGLSAGNHVLRVEKATRQAAAP